MGAGREYAAVTGEVLDRIGTAVGAGALVDDAEALDEASRDTSTLEGRPEVVVRATDAKQISALLKLANEVGFAVTPRGTGTGLAGGAVPACGGVVLALAGMDRILSVDEKNLVAVVEPGVIVKDLQDAARAKGLCYPPDPASLGTASIGGTAATNAGGPACVKYGVTKHYVLGLEAVLPTGEIVRAGTATRKGVVGYDLAQLLVGSEGTLGVITKLWLKLIPAPEATFTQVAVFATIWAAPWTACPPSWPGACCPAQWSSWTAAACILWATFCPSATCPATRRCCSWRPTARARPRGPRWSA